MARNDKERPKGSIIALVGQTATMYSAYSGLLFGLLGAVVLIYCLIVINFRSWTDPFVIITALPAALAGIIWMLFTTHTTLSVPALTGASCAWVWQPPTFPHDQLRPREAHRARRFDPGRAQGGLVACDPSS